MQIEAGKTYTNGRYKREVVKFVSEYVIYRSRKGLGKRTYIAHKDRFQQWAKAVVGE